MNKTADEFSRFIMLLNKLKKICNDPKSLRAVNKHNDEVLAICNDIFELDFFVFQKDERSSKELFRHSINLNFIKAWREYEEKWRLEVTNIWWDDLVEGIDFFENSSTKQYSDEFTRSWEFADERAKRLVGSYNEVFDRAVDSIDVGDLWTRDEDYPELIKKAYDEYNSLWTRDGVDLRGVYRRRSLVPIILIPTYLNTSSTHVFGTYSQNKLSLNLQLREAQGAFIFGLPLAAISHVRAIIELVLTHYYGFDHGDLCQKINNIQFKNLRDRLHRYRCLSNDILHATPNDEADPLRILLLKNMGRYAAFLAGFEKNDIITNNDIIKMEKELVVALKTVRDLIEMAPRL